MSDRHERRKLPDQSQTVYGLGFIGALIYFIQNAVSFWAGVLGLLKAIAWPAALVYKLFNFLK